MQLDWEEDMIMETSKEWEFLKEQIKIAKSEGKRKLNSRIWNMYRFEYLRLIARKHGYELVLTKRTETDVNHFEVKL